MLKINGIVKNKEFKKILKYVLKNSSSKTTIVEIFGVDGAGKSYLVKKIIKELKKKGEIKIFHLWNLKTKQNSKTITPYQSDNYSYLTSLAKEFYIICRMILFVLITSNFFKKKKFYIFERSIYDLVIDPERYRISHKPIMIKKIYNLFYKNTKKIYLNIPYSLSKKRKNEISKKKYLYLTKKLNKYFKKKVHEL
tara:strand:+ start:434 stop:1018 length:585 start_codon:yes stop_codon:yes gene_type:complete